MCKAVRDPSPDLVAIPCSPLYNVLRSPAVSLAECKACVTCQIIHVAFTCKHNCFAFHPLIAALQLVSLVYRGLLLDCSIATIAWRQLTLNLCSRSWAARDMLMLAL